MQTTSLLTLAIAALASGAAIDTTKRDCFGSGEGWGDSRVLAKNHAGSACANVFSKSDGGMAWKKGDTSQKCYNLDSDTKVDLSLEVFEDATLYATDCYNEFLKEIDGCAGAGGYHRYGAFLYRADPNAGQCA